MKRKHPSEAESDGGEGGQDSQLVKVCDPGRGSFNVPLLRGGLVDDLRAAIGELRGIANARRAISMYVAGEDDPLEGTRVVETCMAEAGVSELFMLEKVISDRDILMDLFSANDGGNWYNEKKANWGSDGVALSDWAGVEADDNGNVTEIDMSENDNITGLAVLFGFCQHAVLLLTLVGL